MIDLRFNRSVRPLKLYSLMHRRPIMRMRLFQFALLVVLVTPRLTADYKDAIGFTRLLQECNGELPNGAGIAVAQTESTQNDKWAPEPKGELSEENFTYNPSAHGGYSSHAYEVGRYLYGANSMTPGVDDVFAFRTSTWNGSMSFARNLEPSNPPWRVENHSWGGSVGFVSGDLQILARLDYRILHYDLVAVAGVDNNTGPMRPMVSNSYNSISVGVSSGNHNRGGTNLYTPGRMKPELVAPLPYTSYATPVVASAATLLLAAAEQDAALADGARAPVIKALLLAGATKEAFPNWSNSPTRPLDEVYGAGNLNIYNSFSALKSGKHIPGEHDASRDSGWDWNITAAPDSGRYYPFTSSAAAEGDFSATLAWNAVPSPETEWWNGSWAYQVARLSLRLWKLDEQGEPQITIAESISPIDNIQHIYLPDLAPGNYALEVSGETADVPYGLAWRSPPAPSTGAPPAITAAPAPTAAPVMHSVSFTVESEGSGLVYQWEKDSVPLSNNDRITGATGPTLVISSLAPEDEGVYSVSVSNPFGSVESDSAPLEILPYAPPLQWARVAGGIANIAAAELLVDVVGSDGGPVSVETLPAVSNNGIELEFDEGRIVYRSPADYAAADSFTFSAIDGRNRQTQCTVEIQVLDVSMNVAPTVNALERIAQSDDLRLSFSGIPGAVYRVEASSDLVAWEVIGTAVDSLEGLYEYQEADAFQLPQRFYRLVRE